MKGIYTTGKKIPFVEQSVMNNLLVIFVCSSQVGVMTELLVAIIISRNHLTCVCHVRVEIYTQSQ